MKEYFYFYKITNNINGKFYFGVHSTDDLNDGYMGSGVAIQRAIKKYGIENFTKEYVKFFEDEESMYDFEKQYITRDLVENKNCYNLTTGGTGGGKIGVVVTKDKSGNIFVVDVNDPRYISGELVHNTKGYTVVLDENGKPMQISLSDPNYHKYKHINAGKAVVKDKNGKTFRVSKNDPRLLSGEFVGITSGELTIKDKDGNKIKVQKGDPRFKTGEICGHRKNMVTVKDKQGNIFSILKTDPRYISKEVVPLYSNYIWIVKDLKTKHIPPDQLEHYLSNGWRKGRK